MSDEEQFDNDLTEEEKATAQSQYQELLGLSGKDLILALQKMNPGQKRILALKGTAAVRRLRDRGAETRSGSAASDVRSVGDSFQL